MKLSLNILFIISFLFQSFLFSQNKENGLIKKPLEWSTSKDFYKYYFDLNPVDSSAFKYHVRIPVTSMVFDFWGNDSLQMQGQVVIYLYQYKVKHKKLGKLAKQTESNIIFEIKMLPDSSVQSFMKYFYAYNVLKISLDTLEKQKHEGFVNNFIDCNLVNFYVKNDSIYNQYYMICPKARHDSILYKDIFLNTQTALYETFDYRSIFNPFEQKLSLKYFYARDYEGEVRYIYSKSYQRKLKRDYKKEQKKQSK